jgi:hypothetical protein
MSSYTIRTKVTSASVPNAAAGKLNEFVDISDGLAKAKDESGAVQTYSGNAAVAAHEAAVDPHPQYLTTSEGNAAYTPLSHTTGQVNSHTQIDSHITNTSNPHNTTAAQVGAAPISHVGSGGTEHANATTSVAGFMSAADKTKLNSIITKAGIVAAGSFAGNPKKATVTFSSAMANTNYTIGITGQDSRAWSYESKTINGFVINANSNTALTGEVSWQVISNGEVG